MMSIYDVRVRMFMKVLKMKMFMMSFIVKSFLMWGGICIMEEEVGLIFRVMVGGVFVMRFRKRICIGDSGKMEVFV